MNGVVRRCGGVCVVTLFLFAAVPTAAVSAVGVPKVRSGESVARDLRAGKRVVLSGVTIRGPVNLNNADSVRRLFECHQCRFNGALRAHDVVFQRTVDLAGSTFRGLVDFSGARFEGPALFRAAVSDETPHAEPPCDLEEPSASTRFGKNANFSLVVFDDLVSFTHSRFCAQADFRDTRFSDTSFSRAWFCHTTFARASFRGFSLFNDAQFLEHTSFEDADFRVRADFARAYFFNGANLAGTRYGDDASFLDTSFSLRDAEEEAKNRGKNSTARAIDTGMEAPASESGCLNQSKNEQTPEKIEAPATFEDAVSSGDLNFTFASFEGGIAAFSSLVSGGTLVFRDATFDAAKGAALDDLQVRDLILEVDAMPTLAEREEQLDVLRLIEDSAKQRNDLAIANDAHYERRRLRSEDYNVFWRFLDNLFYRGAAGYLVRPLHPLLVLAALATLATLLRVRAHAPLSALIRPKKWREWRARRRRRTPPARRSKLPPRPRRRWNAFQRRCGNFLSCLLDTLALAAPRRRGEERTPPLPQRFEIVLYRLLLVCALIGLANSNPTLREMLDSLL